MSLAKKLMCATAIGTLAGATSSARGALYDNFSSGFLDTNKWEIRQDVEGQPLTEEYGVVNEGGNFVFHTQQNTITDRRTYLVPKRTFTTGDTFEWDSNLISSSGTYANMALLTGDQYYRLGIRGPAAGFHELGIAHTKMVFQPNNLHIERITPSGNVLFDDLPLTNANGNYQLYVGMFTGHNGNCHMDFDNFYLNGIPSPHSWMVLAGLGLLTLSNKRR